MSNSFSIETSRVDEPAVSDALERRTWASLRIRVQGRTATQFVDATTGDEANEVFVPTFPLAQWVVGNWWALLNEGRRDSASLDESADWPAPRRAWQRRHCLRTADSALVLPCLYLYHGGLSLLATSPEDAPNDERSESIRFAAVPDTPVTRPDVERSLGKFVSDVLGWCREQNDPRVGRLRENWAAIQEAAPDEVAFCRAAGRLGLDPYDVSEWPAGLERWLEEHAPAEGGPSLLGDLLDSVDPSDAVSAWNWVAPARERLGPQSGAPVAVPPVAGSPWTHGYRTARGLRGAAKLSPDDVIDDVERWVNDRVNAFRFDNRNSLTSRAVGAAVGWSGDSVCVEGPRKARPKAQRYLACRGLYLAIAACGSGPRLVTTGHDWEQQASRAFAAELLAPQEAVRRALPPGLDWDEATERRRELAERFRVDDEVIRRQLENVQRVRGPS